MDIKRLKSQLIQAEGVRTKAYKDTLGNWTGGVGHLLPPSAGGWEGHTFTLGQVSDWLDQDIAKAQSAAEKLPEWPALDTDARQNAVVELVFNMGPSRWEGFHDTRAAIQAQEWKKAHDGLLNSRWASQVGPGRSGRLASQLLAGSFPSLPSQPPLAQPQQAPA